MEHSASLISESERTHLTVNTLDKSRVDEERHSVVDFVPVLSAIPCPVCLSFSSPVLSFSAHGEVSFLSQLLSELLLLHSF